jgi:cytidyltransferase-like protein
MPDVYVTGIFDELRSPTIRFLHEASRLGNLTIYLWSDAAVEKLEKRAPKFPEAERKYFLDSIRYVHNVTLVDRPEPFLPGHLRTGTWAIPAMEDAAEKGAFCEAHRLDYCVIPDEMLAGFPAAGSPEPKSSRKKVIVTGCYDWLHSGHIRFFEEASGLGDLYVSLGSDVTIRELKGERHPMLPQEERLYMVQAIRYVTCAFIATGSGYLDAAPEIEVLMPEIYAVNEDGDLPEKRTYCTEHGIEYVVLRRLPKEGLPARQSTLLRGY